MGKTQTESRLISTHHDLQDVIVNVLAADQVERSSPLPVKPNSLIAVPESLPQQAQRNTPIVRLPNAKRKTLCTIAQPHLYFEPMHETVDHVRVQVQRMYVHRQRNGFWIRAALSMLLLSVLGFVFYYLMSNSPSVELSNFFRLKS